jgi:hypothetical protein
MVGQVFLAEGQVLDSRYRLSRVECRNSVNQRKTHSGEPISGCREAASIFVKFTHHKALDGGNGSHIDGL